MNERKDHYSKLNNPTLLIAGMRDVDAISLAQSLFNLIYTNNVDEDQLNYALDEFKVNIGLSIDNVISYARDLYLGPVNVVEFGAKQWFVGLGYRITGSIFTVITKSIDLVVGENSTLSLWLNENFVSTELKLQAVPGYATKHIIPNFGYCIDEVWQRTYMHWKYYDPIISFEERVKLQENACLVSAFAQMECEEGQICADKVLPAFQLLSFYYFGLAGESIGYESD